MTMDIRWDFQDGSLGGWRFAESDDEVKLVELDIKKEPPWFYFLISGVRNRTVQFHVRDVDVSQAPIAISYDRFHWIAPDQISDSRMFQHRFRKNDATVSLTPPYTQGMLYEFTLWARRSPHVNIDYLDRVYGVTGVTITELGEAQDKPVIGIVVDGQENAGAAPSWVAEGIVRFLLTTDPVAKRLRERFCFRVFILPYRGRFGLGENANTQQLIAEAMYKDELSDGRFVGLVSLRGQLWGAVASIGCIKTTASSMADKKDGDGGEINDRVVKSVAQFARWYEAADVNLDQGDLLATDFKGDHGLYRLQVETSWFYPPKLFGGLIVRKSQFELWQEGELLCRALGAKLNDVQAVPALMAPDIKVLDGVMTASVWVADSVEGIQEKKLTVSLYGKGIKGQPIIMPLAMSGEKETTDGSSHLTRFSGRIETTQMVDVQKIVAESRGTTREMDLVMRPERPTDMSLV